MTRRPKPPPADLEAEAGLLGVLLHHGWPPGGLPGVGPGDFADGLHRRLFEICESLGVKGMPIGLASVGEALGGGLDQGLTSYLLRLTELLPGPELIPTYAARLRAASARRRALALAQTLSAKLAGQTPPDELGALVGKLQAEVVGIAGGGVSLQDKLFREAVVTAGDFVNLEIPPRRAFLHPWLLESSITMLAGWRGVGKTNFAIGLLAAISRGDDFGPWQCTGHVRCLYLDAEMAVPDLWQRLSKIPFHPQNLFIYSCHLAAKKGGTFRLTDPASRAALLDFVVDHGIQVVVLDNIASLTPGLDENSKQDWDPLNSFFLELRHRNLATIFLHHVGKGGDQRGTSAREDVLDVSVILELPKGYKREDGCRFIVRFAKSRVPQSDTYHLVDTEFCLSDVDGMYDWSFAPVKESNRLAVIRLLAEGFSGEEIARTLGISRGRVSQIKMGAIKDGLLTHDGKVTEKGHRFRGG